VKKTSGFRFLQTILFTFFAALDGLWYEVVSGAAAACGLDRQADLEAKTSEYF
jgi:hypothetical protein